MRWRVLDQTVAQARAGFANLPSDAVEALADEAVTAVRRARRVSAPKAR